jgi:hypothetical protein
METLIINRKEVTDFLIHCWENDDIDFHKNILEGEEINCLEDGVNKLIDRYEQTKL